MVGESPDALARILSDRHIIDIQSSLPAYIAMPEKNEEKFFWLIDKIANREGIGDILANGTYWAAKSLITGKALALQGSI